MDSDSSSDDELVAVNQPFLSSKSRFNQQNSPGKYVQDEHEAGGQQLTHSLTHSLTYPPTHSLTYLLTHPLTHSHSLTQILILISIPCLGREIVCVDTEEHASQVIKLLRLKNESNIRHQRLVNSTRYALTHAVTNFLPYLLPHLFQQENTLIGVL